MLKYIGKRIFIFIPTLFIITLLGFVIAINAPGDPIERMVVAASTSGDIGSQSVSQIEQKNYWRKKLGLNLPVFYFSLSQLSIPDTLYKVYDKNEFEALSRLINQYGNWEEIQIYYQSVKELKDKILNHKVDTAGLNSHDQATIDDAFNQIKFESLSLLSTFEEPVIQAKINKIRTFFSHYKSFNDLQTQLNLCANNYQAINNKSKKWKNFIPYLNWYGTKNQYHRWLFGDGEFSNGLINFDLKPDFGISYQTKQPIADVILEKIGWSMFFSISSVLLAYLISLPIGVYAARWRGSKFDKISSLTLFMLYSLPSFFIAVLLLMVFANPDVFHFFPASGVKPPEGYPLNANIFEKAKLSLPYLILPLFCYTYTSFAFLSRMMKSSMLEVMAQDFIRTAQAKGLSERVVVWKHAFRNSLLPIITVFANIFPAAVGGSVILETIFTIPGMGFESFLAIQTQNYPMIIAVLTITGVMTLIGYLISDILYAVVDPRIRYN